MKSGFGVKMRIAIALAMVLAMVGAASVGAQGGLTYTSGVQVVNLESTLATIDIYYYNPNGSQAGTLAGETIAGNASKTYFPLLGVDPGFKGSMVISSDKEIAAIANLVTTDYHFNASTTGFSSGATTFSLPLIMCNNSGFNTFFSVQNTSPDTAAHITINYIPGSTGASGVSETATIQPGAAASFDQAVGSPTKDCADLQGATGRFIGSASITSDQPVVATVMELSTTGFAVLMGYNGFDSGSPTVSLPLIMSNNNGFYTGVQIQNIGTVPTDVTLDYSANTGGAFNPVNEVFTLGVGQSKTIIQDGSPPANGSANTWLGAGRYIGAATITNSATQPLVAIVNQLVPASGGRGPFGSSYEGFDPTTASANVTTPLIMANNSGFYTGIQIYNVGANCPSITVNYGANVAPGGVFNPADEVFSLNAGLSKTVIQDGAPPGNGSTVNNWIGVGKFIGSAEISAPGCSILAIVNEFANAAGDRLMTYDGFNH